MKENIVDIYNRMKSVNFKIDTDNLYKIDDHMYQELEKISEEYERQLESRYAKELPTLTLEGETKKRKNKK